MESRTNLRSQQEEYMWLHCCHQNGLQPWGKELSGTASFCEMFGVVRAMGGVLLVPYTWAQCLSCQEHPTALTAKGHNFWSTWALLWGWNGKLHLQKTPDQVGNRATSEGDSQKASVIPARVTRIL